MRVSIDHSQVPRPAPKRSSVAQESNTSVDSHGSTISKATAKFRGIFHNKPATATLNSPPTTDQPKKSPAFAQPTASSSQRLQTSKTTTKSRFGLRRPSAGLSKQKLEVSTPAHVSNSVGFSPAGPSPASSGDKNKELPAAPALGLPETNPSKAPLASTPTPGPGASLQSRVQKTRRTTRTSSGAPLIRPEPPVQPVDVISDEEILPPITTDIDAGEAKRVAAQLRERAEMETDPEMKTHIIKILNIIIESHEYMNKASASAHRAVEQAGEAKLAALEASHAAQLSNDYHRRCVHNTRMVLETAQRFVEALSTKNML